ncbi:Methyltransferase type 11 [Thalassoporum mexicanum PCC 7367]|uniref:class I SAM-dependent methyltransferase n=1 Tax=Thalassoporum mexicanum TaxID=3457544 RepID=UPI00029F8EE5|nr:class I SAM-dependent methyltransferase [Pseudanabaena sp. PCC 7367]AFY69845.1 Methyltransferase type 11 [Pseudanabaena sp. PCC 7367]
MQKPRNSYKDSSFADFYDLIIERLGRGRWDSEAVRLLAKKFGDPILEIGCGTGLKLLPLAKTGYITVGLDNSSEMLRVFQEKLETYDSRVKKRVCTILGEMTNPLVNQKHFRLIILPGSQFLHLCSSEERLSCLQSIYQMLDDNGVVYIANSNLAEKPVYDWVDQAGKAEGNWILQARRALNNGAYQEDFRITSRIDTAIEYLFCWRLYPIEDIQMRSLLDEANLQCITTPSDLPQRLNSNIYLCQKAT